MNSTDLCQIYKENIKIGFFSFFHGKYKLLSIDDK